LICKFEDLVFAFKASSKITSLLVISASKAYFNLLIVYTYVSKTHKWSSNPCKNDCRESNSFFVLGLVPTEVGILKRHIKNEASTSQRGDLVWAPPENNFGRVSVYNM
jgi:hypothetical protein